MARFKKISLIRILSKFLFIVVCGVLGSILAGLPGGGAYKHVQWYGVTAGLAIGGILVTLEYFCRRLQARHLLSVLFGCFIGLLAMKLMAELLLFLKMDEEWVRHAGLVAFFLFSYIAAWVLIYSQEEYQLLIPFVRLRANDSSKQDIILDTSVIIDGRIADMCNTTFLSGRLIIPRFVLKELQAIADSSDSLKRNRGRRGLDVLNRIKENSRLTVKIQDTDFPEISTVDAKLIKLASTMNGRVFTNDYNLGKVAELQNVEVLNINELANILKPVVLPGEIMEVKIIKEGKESSQGVAYLDDGTMIVVENGRRLIGRVIRVVVTSAYQTQAGRMIFAKCERGNDAKTA